MNRSSKTRWLKPLTARRPQSIRRTPRLGLTRLEQREVPAAFTPGDLVVVRTGDGTAALTNTATATFLDEYSLTGTLVQSIPLPTAVNGANKRLTLAGTPTSTATNSSFTGDGLISLSADGRYLLLGGYDAALGATVFSTAGSAVNRVLGRIDRGGNIDTTTALTDGTTSSANVNRNVASPDGFGLYEVGSTAGGNLRFATFGTQGASTPISTTFSGTGATTGLNAALVFNNNLYITGGASGIDGVGQVNGLPTTSGQTETLLPGFPTTGTPFPQARQFFFSPDGSTIYVADSRVAVNTVPAGYFGGLQVWKFNGSTWGVPAGTGGNVPNYVITPNGSQNEGLMGLAADFSAVAGGGNPVFYGITSEAGTGASTANHLIKIVDGGSAGASTVTVLATPSTNEYFRGVAPVPAAVGATSDSITVQSTQSPASIGTPVGFTVTVTGLPANTPTGYVTFQETYNGVTKTVAIEQLSQSGPGQAQAVFTDSTLSVGTTTITAVYGGDGVYVTKTGTFNQVITGTLTNTVVTTNNPNPTANNQSITFTATVTPSQGTAHPTGTVDFFADGLPLNAAGSISVTNGPGNTSIATITVTTNPTQAAGNALVFTPGIHSITAVYTSSGSFVDSTGKMAQPVKANPFTAGDLLVYRAGDGTSALTVNGNTIYIDEYDPSAANQATPKQSIIMPTDSIGGNQALITCSQQSAEGQLSLSSDGQYLLLTGYDTAVGGSTDVHTSPAASIPRTIGRIKYDGTIDTSMALTDLADAGSVRGVASPDGSQIYATGSTGGIRYVSSYTSGLQTSIQIDSGSNNTNGATGPLTLNNLVISGGQLYVTDSANGNLVKVATVGSGIPTTTGQVDTILPGIPTGATTTADPNTNAPGFPLGVYFAHLQTGPVLGADTMYVVDDGANFFGGTITKWSLVSGTWTKVDTILSNGTGINDPIPSFDHLNGTVNNGTVNLFATYGNGGNGFTGPGDLYSISDTGGYNAAIPSHTVSTLASVPVGSNETFRGVSVVPQQAQQAVGVSSVVVNDGTNNQRSEVRSITVTFTGQANFSGGNANAAAAFELDHTNDTASHFATPRPVTLATSVSTNGSGQTVVTLTFSGAETDPISVLGNANPVPGPSLADGRYQLTIFAANIAGFNGGGAGGNYVSPTENFGGTGLHLYRDFADANGDGTVDATDLGQFRSTFNANNTQANYLAYMDANNSGAVDAQDLSQFRTHFNTNVFI